MQVTSLQRPIIRSFILTTFVVAAGCSSCSSQATQSDFVAGELLTIKKNGGWC